MRRSLKRWLLQRHKPQLAPLYQRVAWTEFDVRIHRAIALDMRVLLGEITPAELRARTKTQPLPALCDAETLADQSRCWWYADETAAGIDAHATQPIKVVTTR